MSDELDPQLLRLFRQADESLPDTEFHAKVMADLERSRGRITGWIDLREAFVFFARAALSGIAAGLLTPLKLRHALSGLRIRTYTRT